MGHKRGAYQHKVRTKRAGDQAKPIFANEMREAFKAWRESKGLAREAITRAGVLSTGAERKARLESRSGKRNPIAIAMPDVSD